MYIFVVCFLQLSVVKIGKACLHLIHSVLSADFGGYRRSWVDSLLAVLEGHTQCINREMHIQIGNIFSRQPVPNDHVKVEAKF